MSPFRVPVTFSSSHFDDPSLAVPAYITGVASVTVANGGTGYTSAPTVVFSGGTADDSATPIVLPSATATVSDGKVTSITMLTNGSGYATTPTVSFVGGGGTGASGTAHLGTWNLTSTNLNDTFVRYVAAETSDTANGANSLYYAMRLADWETNYQGTVDSSGNFNPTAPQAITGDASFKSAINQGAATLVHVTTTSANAEASGETWRQISLPVHVSVAHEPLASVEQAIAVTGWQNWGYDRINNGSMNGFEAQAFSTNSVQWFYASAWEGWSWYV